MTLQDFIREYNAIPNNFVTDIGTRCEFEAGKMSNGEHSAMLWQTNPAGTKKIHLIDIKYGKTAEEAKENLKKSLLK